MLSLPLLQIPVQKRMARNTGTTMTQSQEITMNLTRQTLSPLTLIEGAREKRNQALLRLKQRQKKTPKKNLRLTQVNLLLPGPSHLPPLNQHHVFHQPRLQGEVAFRLWERELQPQEEDQQQVWDQLPTLKTQSTLHSPEPGPN